MKPRHDPSGIIRGLLALLALAAAAGLSFVVFYFFDPRDEALKPVAPAPLGRLALGPLPFPRRAPRRSLLVPVTPQPVEKLPGCRLRA